MTLESLWKRVHQEANGELNRWFTGERLDCNPDGEEALQHFLEHGGYRYTLNKVIEEEYEHSRQMQGVR